MFECDVVREQMPLLLTEALPASDRELAHTHIESCAVCTEHWRAARETWRIMDALPEVRVPSKLRASFLAEAKRLQPATSEREVADNVVPFRRRPAARWIAQAAAIAVLVGGSFFAGRGTKHTVGVAALPNNGSVLTSTDSGNGGTVMPASYNIAESRVIPAASLNPDFQGRPDIDNVRFFETKHGANEIGVAFDVTQHITVTGAPTERNMVKLVSYFLQNQDSAITSRSNAVQWVRDQYASKGVTDPELVKALTNMLKNDAQEGVRIKAVDALTTIPQSTPEVRSALVEALKNDPNPAVRMKAVEALTKMAQQNAPLEPAALETLRQKASQNDENPYVRVKAAEALSSQNL